MAFESDYSRAMGDINLEMARLRLDSAKRDAAREVKSERAEGIQYAQKAAAPPVGVGGWATGHSVVENRPVVGQPSVADTRARWELGREMQSENQKREEQAEAWRIRRQSEALADNPMGHRWTPGMHARLSRADQQLGFGLLGARKGGGS